MASSATRVRVHISTRYGKASGAKGGRGPRNIKSPPPCTVHDFLAHKLLTSCCCCPVIFTMFSLLLLWSPFLFFFFFGTLVQLLAQRNQKHTFVPVRSRKSGQRQMLAQNLNP